MACTYSKEENGCYYCRSPYYSGNNTDKSVSNAIAKKYCYGNYNRCPDTSFSNSNNDNLRRDREVFKRDVRNKNIFIFIVICIVIFILYKNYGSDLSYFIQKVQYMFGF